MDERVCPVCGGNELIKTETEEIIRESFGGQRTVSLNEYTCQACGSTGDFFNENEASIKKILSALKSDAAANILEDFSQNKISLSSMERTLELPQRTLTKWKNKASNPSSTGIALLKLLRVFPWLLDVAENKYDYALSQKIHMTAAFKEMLTHIKFSEDGFFDSKPGTTANPHFLFIQVETPMSVAGSDGQKFQNPSVPQIEVSY